MSEIPNPMSVFPRLRRLPGPGRTGSIDVMKVHPGAVDAAFGVSFSLVAVLCWVTAVDLQSAISVVVALALGALVYVVLGRPLVIASQRPDWRWWVSLVGFEVLLTWATIAHANAAYAQIAVLVWIWTSQTSFATGVAGSLTVGFAIALGSGIANDRAWLYAGLLGAVAAGFSVLIGWRVLSLANWGKERAALVTKLQAAQAGIAAAQREAGATAAREQLAAEVHDTIAQNQAGIVMVAQRVLSRLPDSDPTTDPARQDLLLIADLGREMLTQTRMLVAANARPDTSAGLPTALRHLAQRFSRESGLPIDVTVTPETLPPGIVHREIEVICLRAAQEALANVRKHAQAQHCWMSLEIHHLAPSSALGRSTTGRAGTDDRDDLAGAGLVLQVRDDGRGIDPEAIHHGGFGLMGLRDRVAVVHGSVDIINWSDPSTASSNQSKPSSGQSPAPSATALDTATRQGTQVTVRLPLTAPAQPDA